MQIHNAEAYAYYWMIVEMIYGSGGYLSLDYDSIAFALRIDSEKTRSIINDFGLFVIDERKKMITSKRILKNLEYRKYKSRKASESANIRWNKDNANALRTQCDSNAIKVKVKVKDKDILQRSKKPVVCGSQKQASTTNGAEIKELVGHYLTTKAHSINYGSI